MKKTEETAAEREWATALGRGEDAAWKRVWENVIVPETRLPKSRDLMNRYSITDGDLMGMLFDEMVGRGKISLYRGEGSLAGWLRKYVRGFITAANPAKHGEVSISTARPGDEEEKDLDIPTKDIAGDMREIWNITHKCFVKLWNEDPERAYVHLLKTRFFFTSEEVKDFLDMSSTANVDQIFSRNIKFMRAAWPKEK
ncbi:MAG: hypothetical protein J5807_02775 [Kiritimatiellae bacterium]|nr:hypothetical protein [Kiritimatiellia bacterium]